MSDFDNGSEHEHESAGQASTAASEGDDSGIFGGSDHDGGNIDGGEGGGEASTAASETEAANAWIRQYLSDRAQQLGLTPSQVDLLATEASGVIDTAQNFAAASQAFAQVLALRAPGLANSAELSTSLFADLEEVLPELFLIG